MFGIFSSMINAKQQHATNNMNWNIHQEDIAAQNNMQDKAEQYALINFERENMEYDRRYHAYLSPEAQVRERLKAGLNPYLDSSSISSSAGSVGTPQGPSGSVPQGSPMQAPEFMMDPRSLADFLKLPQEIALLASQSRSSASQSAAFDSESVYKSIMAKLFEEDLPFRKAFNQMNLSDKLASIGFTNARTRGQNLENEFNNTSMKDRLNVVAGDVMLKESMSNFYDQQLLYYQALGRWIAPEAQSRINYYNAQVGTQKAMQEFYKTTADNNRIDISNKLAGSFEAYSNSLREMGLSENAIREQYNIASQMLITTAENLKAICDQNISEAERRALVIEAEQQCPSWLREGGIAHQFLSRVSEGVDIIQAAKGVLKNAPKPKARTQHTITTDPKGRQTSTHTITQDVDLP